MSIAVVLLATALSAPRLTITFDEQVNDRYPQWALHTDQSAGALVELVVNPQGRIESCVLLDSVGNARLAAEMCEETEGLRLRSATDTAGNPVYGKIRTLLRFSAQGNDDLSLVENSGEPNDLEVPLAQLPAAYPNGFVVEVDVLVDTEGSVQACDAAFQGPPPGFEPYISQACERAGQLRLDPFTGSSDAAAPYVTRRRVRFKPESPRA